MNKEKQGENTGESRGWHREGEEREGKRRAGKSRGRPGRARRARRASRAGGQGRGGKNRGRMTGSGGDKSQSSAVIMIGVVRQVGSSDRPPICLLNTCLVEDLVGAGAVRPPRRPADPPTRRPLRRAVGAPLSSRWTDPAPWLADAPYLSGSLSERSRPTHLHVWRGISALLPDLFALLVCHIRFVCFQHARLLWFLLGCRVFLD